jgi:hypothetical protein
MFRINLPHQLTAAFVLFLALALAAWLIATGRSDPTGPHSMALVKAPTVQPAQLKAFAVLRDAPEPPLLANVLAMERVVEGRNFGLMFSYAHRVPTSIHQDAWVIPGDGFICVMASKPIVAGCNTTAETIQHGMSVVAIQPPLPHHKGKRYTLFGIAPDGVKTMRIRGVGERRATALVVENVYSYAAPTMMRATIER